MGSSPVFWFWLVCYHAASSYSALPSEVHKFIDAHFRIHCYGIDLYFCQFEDAVANLRFARNNTVVNRRVKLMKTMDEGDDPVVEKFLHRASVFLDASCDEGIQLLSRNVLKMDIRFRWLIFTEDVTSVLKTVESSRLEMDSDVTLISKQKGTLEFSRLSRIYFKSNFTLPTNYSLQETIGNEELSQAILWRKEEFNFENQSFDVVVVFVESKLYKLEDWPRVLNKSVEYRVEYIRKYFSHAAWYLMELYNFTVNITNIKDWGSRLPNGSFSGAVGMVERREVEFGFTGVRMFADRIGVLDFSIALFHTRFHFVMIQPKTFGTAAALIVPFETAIWWAFIIFVLILIAAMRINSLNNDGLHNDSWGGSMLLVFGGISQNGIPDTAFKFSTQFLYLVILIFFFVMYNYYGTAVLNGLILPSSDPIQNIQQLIASNTELGSHDIIYLRKELLKENDSIILQVRRKLIPQPFLELKEGLNRVRKGGFAFYGLDFTLLSGMNEHYTEEETCLITEIQLRRSAEICYFWRKRSPFTEILNRGLLKMKERGIDYYLHKYWLAQKPKCTVNIIFTPINLQGMALAYGVFAVGLVICLNVAVLEMLVAKIMKRKTLKELPFLS